MSAMWIALSGPGLELDSIAAAIVGGTAFVGGRGGLLGTIAGVLIIQILSTMAVLMGLDIEVAVHHKRLGDSGRGNAVQPRQCRRVRKGGELRKLS